MNLTKSNSYYITSQDSEPGQLAGNFRIQLSNRMNGIHFFSVDYFQVQRTWYSINSTNNTIRFNDGVNTLTAVVPDGNYSPSLFITALQTVMNGTAPPPANAITVTLLTDGENAGKLRITMAAGTFSLLWDGLANSINEVTGFDDSDLTGSLTYLSQNVVQLGDKSLYIDVLSNGLTRYNTQSNASSLDRPNLLARIPVGNSVFGDLITYEPQVKKIYEYGTDGNEIVGKLDIQLRDRKNNIINLNGGCFAMGITFYQQ